MANPIALAAGRTVGAGIALAVGSEVGGRVIDLVTGRGKKAEDEDAKNRKKVEAAQDKLNAKRVAAAKAQRVKEAAREKTDAKKVESAGKAATRRIRADAAKAVKANEAAEKQRAREAEKAADKREAAQAKADRDVAREAAKEAKAREAEARFDAAERAKDAKEELAKKEKEWAAEDKARGQAPIGINLQAPGGSTLADVLPKPRKGEPIAPGGGGGGGGGGKKTDAQRRETARLMLSSNISSGGIGSMKWLLDNSPTAVEARQSKEDREKRDAEEREKKRDAERDKLQKQIDAEAKRAKGFVPKTVKSSEATEAEKLRKEISRDFYGGQLRDLPEADALAKSLNRLPSVFL